MEKPKTYCEYTRPLEQSNLHRIYHDTQYGFPIKSDNELFGRLILEINQAGLSWNTILNKQYNFRKAYSNFDVTKVARYKKKDVTRLLADSGIIRNRLKINATIYNAEKIISLQKQRGSFKKWIDGYHPMSLDEWVRLFKQTFKFTGPEISKEFLLSSGYLEGAHESMCPIIRKVISKKPAWNRKSAL